MSMDETGLASKWIVEHFTQHSMTCHAVKKFIRTAKTNCQNVEIVDTCLYGKCLFLDGKLQSSELDEFIYHESLVHPALTVHPSPKEILVIGGGEGATLREALRHPMVVQAHMIDVDEELVDLCKKHLTDFSKGAFDDPRAKLVFFDARKWLEENTKQWDVIIIDLPEPLRNSPACLLYTREFYSTVLSRLREEGTAAVQAGTTHVGYNALFANVNRTLRDVFPVVRAYHTFIPSYQLPWGFSLASKCWDPLCLDEETLENRLHERKLIELKHYSARCHRGMFNLPKYLEQTIERDGKIIDDENPYYWEA